MSRNGSRLPGGVDGVRSAAGGGAAATDESALRRTATAPAPGEPWTVLRMMLWSAGYLEAKGVGSARLDAEHMLAHALGVERLQLYLQFERPLVAEELELYRPLLRRRAAREPLQYILGRQAFRELDLEVAKGVLIPRPETELLVEGVLRAVRDDGRADGTVLDVGTGSGAIALSLAFEGSFASVVASDVDPVALDVARRNAESSGLSDRVDFRAGSLFEVLDRDERFDVIVSNPPYVAEREVGTLEPEVRDWEPKVALFAGPEGLDVLRLIVAQAADHLKPGGLLAVEIGVGQHDVVSDWLEASGRYADVDVVPDYAGKQRFVFARGA